MPIQIGAKGATLFGNTYPAYAYIDWFTPDQEALAKAGGDAYDTPSRGFSPQETAALKGVVSGDWNASSGGAVRLFAHGANTASANFSFLLEAQALAAFYGWRPIYINYGAAQTITAAKGAVSPTTLNNGTGLTWQALTFGGASSGSQGAGSGTGQNVIPSILVPDWIMTPSAARSDTPGANPLVQIRSHFAAASTQQSIYSNAMGDMAAATGVEWATAVTAGDMVSSITTWTPARNGTWMCPVGVEFLYGVPTRVIADVGDSLSAGQEGATVSAGWRSVSQRAAALRNGASAIWQASSFAVRGQATDASYQTGLEVVSKLKPQYLCFHAYSPNDGAPTQALVDASWARALALVEHCRRNGVTPVLVTNGPVNSYNAGHEALRQQINARVRSMAGAVIVSDEAAPLENSLSPGQINAAYYTGDATHYNSAGYDAMAAVRAAACVR